MYRYKFSMWCNQIDMVVLGLDINGIQSDEGLRVFYDHAVGEYAIWNKNIERHTAHTIVSWPNPKQWQMGHASHLMMMMIR